MIKNKIGWTNQINIKNVFNLVKSDYSDFVLVSYTIIYFYYIFSLGAIHSDAYEAYQTSHDLKTVIQKIYSCDSSKILNNTNGKMNIKLSLLTPILPMLVSF